MLSENAHLPMVSLKEFMLIHICEIQVGCARVKYLTAGADLGIFFIGRIILH